jgi:hypothetical protein
MDAPLFECTILEQHALIRFVWAERVKPGDLNQRMLAQYGSVNCMSPRIVYNWVETFKSRRTSESDKAHGSQQKIKFKSAPMLKDLAKLLLG